MHPKTLFRILLKFAGVCLFIFGLLSLIPESAALLTDSDTGPVRMPLGYHVRMWTRITLEIAAGLYLFFRAAFGGTLLARVVSFSVWRAVVAGGPQLSSIR